MSTVKKRMSEFLTTHNESFSTKDHDLAKRNVKEFQAALLSDILELIGEDELDEHGKQWAGEDSMREIGRDDLRAELRQRVREYFGGGK